MDNDESKSLPRLNDRDYWAEIVDSEAVFHGCYVGYEFTLTYSFILHKWLEEDGSVPTNILNRLKWELYLRERWLPAPTDNI